MAEEIRTTRRGRAACKSRSHFIRCVVIEGDKEKISWKCDHCKKYVFNGANFRAHIARIHLAAKQTDGRCANLCSSNDEKSLERKLYYRQMIAKLQREKKTKDRKRKQQAEAVQDNEVQILGDLRKKKKKKQATLPNMCKAEAAAAADIAVASWAIAHDIPANALKGVFWKNMNNKLTKVAVNYCPVNPQKLYKVLLPQLKKLVVQRSHKHLSHQPSVGRTFTGDGATKNKVPLINFLVHIPGKGVTLLDVTDCTGHIAEGGIKDAL